MKVFSDMLDDGDQIEIVHFSRAFDTIDFVLFRAQIVLCVL